MSTSVFHRHRAASILAVWAGLLVGAEVLLRGLGISILDFTYQARQVHRYSPSWKVDTIPNRVAHLKLRAPDGHLLYNFLVTVGPHGFRTYDRQIDENISSWDATRPDRSADRKIIHAIGDSYTMGWGVDYASSYPAILDRLLPASYRVLNLGLDGFGAIAATGKSMSLWDRFPADHVVYVFSPNDFEDDARALQMGKRGAIFHGLFTFYDVLRRHTYLANLSTALKWRFYFAENRNDRTVAAGKVMAAEDAAPRDLTVQVDASNLPAPDPANPSLRQIQEYARFTAAQGSTFTVFVFAHDRASLTLHAFCKQIGVDAYALSVPPEMKLLRDGHLNFLGNYHLAHTIRDRLPGT